MTRFLTVAAVLAGIIGSAQAECDHRDIVTQGETLGARAATGEALLTLKAVGNISIVRRGDGSGHLTTTATCDPEMAAALRKELQDRLDGVEGGVAINHDTAPLYPACAGPILGGGICLSTR